MDKWIINFEEVVSARDARKPSQYSLFRNGKNIEVKILDYLLSEVLSFCYKIIPHAKSHVICDTPNI